MRRMGAALLLAVWLTVLVGPSAVAGEEDLVVRKVIHDLEIALFMEKPKDMLMAGGMSMSATNATHHLEVKVFDASTKACVPYLQISARITGPNGKATVVEVPPMIGSAFHYGTNVKLPGKGTYSISLAISPPKLMRYTTSKDRWAKPASLSAQFVYR